MSEQKEDAQLENSPLIDATSSSGTSRQSDNGHAKIYIWKPDNLSADISSEEKVKLGHVSLQLYDSQGKPLADGYISAWPGDRNQNLKTQYIKNLAQDQRNIMERAPDEIFRVDGLNVYVMKAHFENFKGKGSWRIRGAGFFRKKEETINCSGLALQLIHEGIQKSGQVHLRPNGCSEDNRIELVHFHDENKCWGVNLEKTEEVKIFSILSMAGATYDTLQGWKRFGWAAYLTLALLVGGGGVALFVYAWLNQQLSEGTKEAEKIGGGIAGVIGLLCLLISLYQFTKNCCNACTDLAGVSPKDVSDTLNYLCENSDQSNINIRKDQPESNLSGENSLSSNSKGYNSIELNIS